MPLQYQMFLQMMTDWYSSYTNPQRRERQQVITIIIFIKIFWSPSLKSSDKLLTENHHLLFQRLKLKLLQVTRSHIHVKKQVTCVKCLAFNLSCSFETWEESIIMKPDWGCKHFFEWFFTLSFAPCMSFFCPKSVFAFGVLYSLLCGMFLYFFQMLSSHFPQSRIDSITKPESTFDFTTTKQSKKRSLVENVWLLWSWRNCDECKCLQK